jgi:hypothetical protein
VKLPLNIKYINPKSKNPNAKYEISKINEDDWKFLYDYSVLSKLKKKKTTKGVKSSQERSEKEKKSMLIRAEIGKVFDQFIKLNFGYRKHEIAEYNSILAFVLGITYKINSV